MAKAYKVNDVPIKNGTRDSGRIEWVHIK